MLETVTLRGRRLQPFGGIAAAQRGRSGSRRFGLAGPQAPSTDTSQYLTQNTDGTYSVNTDGLSQLVVAQSPSFGAALEKGLVDGIEAATIADMAVGAVVLATTEGASVALSAVAAGDAATLLGAAGGASLTGVGVAVGLAVLVEVALLSAWPAQSGPGCCGSQQLTTAQATALLTPPIGGQPPTQAQIARLVNFGTCDPGEFNDWSRQQWVFTDSPIFWSSLQGSAEEFLDAVVEGVFAASSTCWSVAPPLGPILGSAVASWNATHQSSSTRTISRTVNNSYEFTFGGSKQTYTGQPYSAEPISVALNELAMASSSPPAAGDTMSMTINDGPALTQLPNPQGHASQGGTSAPASSSSGKAIVVVGAGAAAGAGALYWYAQRHGITMRQALTRLFK